jgi:hypothetical protein
MAIILNGTTGPNFDTGQRITGDFSTTPSESSRVAFQTSTADGLTSVGVIPNGTNKFAGFKLYNSSDPDNASTFIIHSNSAGTFINLSSSFTGTGTSLPIQVGTGGATRAIFQTNGDFQFNSGYGSAATAYGCRAWVNFNGTGTVAISASGNVSSITDNGTGKYRINFTTSMPDANYAAGALGTEESGNAGDRSDLSIQSAKGSGSFATSYLDVTSVYSSSAALFDAFKITVAVFR